jgi:hypothetical protein
VSPPVFGPLARLVSPADPTLTGLAGQLALPLAGLVVFNRSPFGRSDVIELPDGRLRLITDVPGLGFAYEPGGAGGQEGRRAATAVRESLRPIQTGQFSARLDESTGAVSSLVERESGRDLVAAGGAFNRLEGAVLSHAWTERYHGLGLRLVARRAAAGGELTSRLTIYDSLPWVDLENVGDHGTTGAAEWRFDLSFAPAEVRREVAGGIEAGSPALTRRPMVRWLDLRGQDLGLFLGTDGPAAVSLDAGGVLVSHRATHSARFRLTVHRGPLLPEDPWRFGFGMPPLEAVAAAGTGPVRLPSFGTVLEVADSGVAVVGIKDADDGVGVAVYLMDLVGAARDVTVRPGLVAFDSGAVTDLTERDLGPLAAAPGGGVLVPIEAGGYTAFRLLGIRLAG